MLNMIENLPLEFLAGPRPEISGKPPLLILFHGFGSNKEDLYSLRPYFPFQFQIISAQAPISLEQMGAPGGFAWFPIEFSPTGIQYLRKDAEKAAKAVEIFVKETIKQVPCDPEKVFILGFSQGAMMTHALLLGNPGMIAGAACLSGRMVDHVFLDNPDWTGLHQKPVFISHGKFDEVLPIKNGQAIQEWYSQSVLDVTYREYDMGHEINDHCLKDLTNWFKKNLS